MEVATPKQMNEIDSRTIHRIGIPGIVLMENAALKVVQEVNSSLVCLKGKNIAVFAGKGNNGGDAFAVARHLYNQGANLWVYLTTDKAHIAGDARTNLDILESMGIQTVELAGQVQLDQVGHTLSIADLIIDGIFGTGLKGEIEGLLCEIIQLINQSGKTVLSIDIPSGISGETGKVLGTCIKASKTVTFGLPKPGLLIHPGCEFTGELSVADIGIPSSVINSMDIKTNTIEREFVSTLLPQRPFNSNKGNYGKVLIVSGSLGMTGAGCLAAAAALRTGAGLVYLGVPASLSHIYNTSVLESVVLPLEDHQSGYLSKECVQQLLDRMKGMSCAAVGPGLSAKEDIVDIVSEVISRSEIPLILDADALNAVARDVSILRNLKVPAVVTPHPGEMGRLIGLTNKEVQNNRIDAAREFASKWKVTTVLKGSKTIVAFPDGTVYINRTGNPGMATGGTGDVLAGVIASLVGQGLPPENAAVCGVYLHGFAGDIAVEAKGMHGLIASDLIHYLPAAIRRLQE